jgi:hypothetical protein
LSLLDVPPFESLAQGTAPYLGFGSVATDTEAAINFSRVVGEASARIAQTFGRRSSVYLVETYEDATGRTRLRVVWAGNPQGAD